MALRETRALLGKELQQHGWVLAGLTALLALAFFALKVSVEKGARVLSSLEVLAAFARGPLLAAAVYLGHRLVVRENYGRTQRFVEALPIRRGQFDLIKAAFGLFWLELWASGALLVSLEIAAAHEPVGQRFAVVLAARLGAYVLASWGAIFLFGFFGRLRLLLAAAVAVLLFLLDRHTTWQLERFGPFALLDDATFAFEREHLPMRALAQSIAIGLGAVAVAFALRRVREGSIVESLARRLSPRELYALLVVGIGAIAAFSAFDREKPPAPYAITTDRVLRSERLPLSIAYFEDDLRPAAQRLMVELEAALPAVAETLGLPSLPSVLLVHAPELDRDRPRLVQLHQTEGLVARVNLESPADHPRAEVVAYVIHQLLWVHTRGRAGIEPRHWLLDGFSLHVALQASGRHDTQPAGGTIDRWTLRAVLASEIVPLTTQALRSYDLTSERAGDPLFSALAAHGWELVEARAGHERASALARAAFARAGTHDVRDYLHDLLHPLPAMFERETGLRYDAFVADWARVLDGLRHDPAVSAALAAVPRGPADAAASTGGRLDVSATAAPPPSADLTCHIRHGQLTPYDAPVDDGALTKIDQVWKAGQPRFTYALEGAYGSGERAVVELDCDVLTLGGPARLGFWRVTVR